MSKRNLKSMYNEATFRREASVFLAGIDHCQSLETVREILLQRVMLVYRNLQSDMPAHNLIRMRDCAHALMSILFERSDQKTGFCAAQALWDIARRRKRPDLQAGFYAEMINWVRGYEGRAEFQFLVKPAKPNEALSGREQAVARSAQLDALWKTAEQRIGRYAHGLEEPVVRRRERRTKAILRRLGGRPTDWGNWKWHVRNIVRDGASLAKLAAVDGTERRLVEKAVRGGIPFGITPYYASLFTDETRGDDRAIRAQVLPPTDYVQAMLAHRADRHSSMDFMMEHDTSPVDLITRRYPGIVILKPVSTCPQICVYCQRNWEIDKVMSPRAFAKREEIDRAISWIREHPAIREVLVTGGDPFILSDERIEYLLSQLAAIRHIDLVRFGTRTLVTMPMRVTERLAKLLGSYRELGKREVAVVTHVEHPYEITPDMAQAVDRLRRQGIGVYNQQVYTFFTSRRFESALLRILLRRIGIDPYYTFMPKGKEETRDYQVPVARILQEQKEEARLIPGLRRTDEAVFNVPGLGKNYLRAIQHRNLLAVLPDGKRVYEFHPWEVNLASCQTYVHKDIAILDYLKRLQEIGEDPSDYDSIWFYF